MGLKRIRQKKLRAVKISLWRIFLFLVNGRAELSKWLPKIKVRQIKNLEFQLEKGCIKTDKVWMKENIAHMRSSEYIVNAIYLLIVE